MKARFAKSFSFVAMLALIFLGVVPRGYPQTPAGLGIKLTAGYADLTITGAVGSAYSIEYVTDLAQTNSWLSLTNLTLPSSPYVLTDTTTPATGRRFYRAITVGFTNLAWIPPGTFTMGSPTNETERVLIEPQHEVTLTKGFYMGKYEVTQREYQTVIGSNPSYHTPDNGYTEDLDRPVERVSWIDATNYCAQRTQQEQADGRIPTNWLYRLPTEAEWEYACRAGTEAPFHYGQNLFSDMANFGEYDEYSGGTGTVHNASATFLSRTTTVGSYQPNALGLFDMHGNVWEWCQDWYDGYPTESVIDPQGPPSGSERVLRGGGWQFGATYCRSAKRDSGNPAVPIYTDYGFRVVLVPGQ